MVFSFIVAWGVFIVTSFIWILAIVAFTIDYIKYGNVPYLDWTRVLILFAIWFVSGVIIFG